MKKVHITLQGKGGVGKSFVSALNAQFIAEKGEPVIVIDTDPVNATLSGYKSLSAQRVELMEGSKINERRFDDMMQSIVDSDSNFVIDNGAASFVPMANYLLENEAINVIGANGKQVVLHTVITGGQALLDTLEGFDHLAEQMPPEAKIIVWLNEYFGKISSDGKEFEDMKVYAKHKDRITGIVRIPRQTNDTFGKDVELMLDKKMTFAQVAGSSDFGLMAKQRLAMVKRTIFGQLDSIA